MIIISIIIILIIVQQSMHADYNVQVCYIVYTVRILTYLNYYNNDQGMGSQLHKMAKCSYFNYRGEKENLKE